MISQSLGQFRLFLPCTKLMFFSIEITSKNEHEISTLTIKPFETPRETQIRPAKSRSRRRSLELHLAPWISREKNKSKYPRTEPGPDFTGKSIGFFEGLFKKALWETLLRIYFEVLPPNFPEAVQLPTFGLADGTSGVHLWESPKTSWSSFAWGCKLPACFKDPEKSTWKMDLGKLTWLICFTWCPSCFSPKCPKHVHRHFEAKLIHYIGTVGCLHPWLKTQAPDCAKQQYKWIHPSSTKQKQIQSTWFHVNIIQCQLIQD